MEYLGRCIKKYRAINYLLVAVLLIKLLFPLHFHIYHDIEHGAGSFHHVIDFHLLNDGQLNEHHPDKNSHELKTIQLVITKQVEEFNLSFLLFVCLLILPISILSIRCRLKLKESNSFRFYNHYILSPPLRAPPAN